MSETAKVNGKPAAQLVEPPRYLDAHVAAETARYLREQRVAQAAKEEAKP